MAKPKVLIYDIEIVQNNLGDSWRTMGADHSFLTCFGYRWEHCKRSRSIDLNDTYEIYNLDPQNKESDEQLVMRAHELMKEADLIVHHYGNGFDWKYLNAKFDKYGLPDLSYIPKRDTCLKARSKYKISSKRLSNLCKYFGVTQKLDIDHSLWLSLYLGGERAEKAMKEISYYCRGDVDALYDLYQKMKHHFPAVYHAGDMEGKDRYLSCPECASYDIIKRQPYTLAGGTRRYRMSCNNCNKWFSITVTKQLEELEAKLKEEEGEI